MQSRPFVILLTFFLLNGFFFSLQAQVPSTDIYLFDISLDGGRVNFHNKLRVTDRDGYDNQPSFTLDGKYMLFSSIRDGDQADIYRFHLSKHTTDQLTNTPESEYSPMQIPGLYKFSAVRVEMDSSQRLWKFKMRKGKLPTPVMRKVNQIGYYTWMDKESVAMFILGNPPTLKSGRWEDESPSVIARNVGRSLNMVPLKWILSYVDKSNPDRWVITNYGMFTKKKEVVIETLPGVEDFCWSPDGYMLMGKDKTLYSFHPDRDESWQFVGDLGIGNFYRLAISPDGKKLAVVAYRE